ncbi:MAG: hypothetical protein VX583_05595 [Bdellovibrionota bacterium]|tara:strand:+ start:20185 stop:21150 length:966 start_codon:yes stop_codon:yes gene_type:complete
MGAQGIIQSLVDGLVVFASDLLIPLLVFTFIVGATLRALIWWTIRREAWFSREFEKRVRKFLDVEVREAKFPSFYQNLKRLLEKTYYELFEMRAIMKRRNPDIVASFLDRVFLIQHGTAWLVRDSLAQVKYLKHDKGHPKFLEVAKNVFKSNPCFTNVFGVIPGAKFNDLLNILPGLFVIGGIFGTFLGIMKALPELSGMDLNDIEGTKLVMDTFLLKISFSMSTSIIGIILSVAMSLVNTIMSPEKAFVDTVERFENSLDNLWNQSENNELPPEDEEFDEHRDPLEALAEQALSRELESQKKQWVREGRTAAKEAANKAG